MLSRAQIKYIQSLDINKFRRRFSVYLAEGERIANELLHNAQGVQAFYGLPEWIAQHEPQLKAQGIEYHTITPDELKKISTLTTPNQVLAVVDLPDTTPPQHLQNGLYVALDNLRDPGNLGTIIRTADWFGFNGVICSPQTVDAYNPKVVQATMGSILHLPIWYADLAATFAANPHLPVMAATLDGTDINQGQLPTNGILLIGNEAHGVSPELQALANQRLKIPQYGQAESLNAAMAAGILMAYLRGR